MFYFLVLFFPLHQHHRQGESSSGEKNKKLHIMSEKYRREYLFTSKIGCPATSVVKIGKDLQTQRVVTELMHALG
uniref:Uncharacterized protein n=1 Tax=Anguilla anguilla TaxID=7936 RepID=A0A0E9PYY7_ANGAN